MEVSATILRKVDSKGSTVQSRFWLSMQCRR